MNIKVKKINIKTVKYYSENNFIYQKNKNIKNIENILKNKKFFKIESHIFNSLLKTNENLPSIIRLLKNKKIKFSMNYILELLKDKQKINLILKSIISYGFLHFDKSPVVIAKYQNKYILVDGFHRFFSSMYLNIKNIDAEIYYEK